MIKNLFNKNSIENEYQSLINQINLFEKDLTVLSDSELRAKTFQLKKKISNRKKFIVGNF